MNKSTTGENAGNHLDQGPDATSGETGNNISKNTTFEDEVDQLELTEEDFEQIMKELDVD